MADGNPFASELNPNAARTGLWDLRMMSAANRMETPFMRGVRGGGRRSMAEGTMLGNMAGMANEPDYSTFTFNPDARAAATQALAPYGQAPIAPEAVKQNVMLPNTGFFGAHPRLSAALEGGLFGAAATRGGETIGDSIQGVAEGLIGAKRIREGMYRQQFARPFEAAGMMENLRDMQQKRELQDADIQHLRALNEHLVRGDYEKVEQLKETNRHAEAVEATRQQGVDATAPRNLGGGLYGYYNPGGTGPNQRGEWSIQENPEAKLGRSSQNAGPWYTYKNSKGQTITGRVHEGGAVPEGARFVQGTYDQKQGDTNQRQLDSNRRSFVEKNLSISNFIKMFPSAATQKGFNMMDEGARTKMLNDYFDKNIAPYAGSAPEGGVPGFTQNPDGSFTEK